MTESQIKFVKEYIGPLAKHINQYNVQDGIIHQLGKFEAEPYYVPFLWYDMEEDYSGDCGEKSWNIEQDDELVALIPELARYRSIELYESDNGFVSHGNCSMRRLDP
ncbi:MAG: hypothetical protein GY941_21760 [Planctomycetes bacterium]|nr:hypothetical protein [Planctomycetota bacterium]